MLATRWNNSRLSVLICLPLTRERCRQLNLPLMVNRNQAHYRTNFTVSIEAAEGITTGISAYDRAHTIRTAVKPDATPKEVSQPGHVFPLMSAPGGVLARAGHTEASVDLAPQDDGSYDLDFNLAYSPPCAFNDFSTCPVASPRNRLPIRLEVGEKYDEALNFSPGD